MAGWLTFVPVEVAAVKAAAAAATVDLACYRGAFRGSRGCFWARTPGWACWPSARSGARSCTRVR